MCLCLFIFLVVFMTLCQQTISGPAHTYYPHTWPGNQDMENKTESTISPATLTTTIRQPTLQMKTTMITITTVKNIPTEKPTVSTNGTKKQEKSEPITLKVTPNVTVFEGTGNLTCLASGSNLPKIRPYKLVWFEQGDGGSDNAIKIGLNDTIIVLDQNIVEKHRGRSVFCALVFYHLSTKHYWTVKSKYISLVKSVLINDKSIRKLGNTNGEIPILHETFDSNLNKMVIESVTVIACLLVIIVTAGLLYRRFRNKDRTPPEDEPSVAMSQDNIYTYVPLQPIPFYEARKMVAANLKNKPNSVKPPPLPARHQHHKAIQEEDEYVYSYTYGIKK